MKNELFIRNTTEVSVGALSFILLSSQFPSGGLFTRNGTLTDFWLIPFAFFVVAAMSMYGAEGGLKIPWWFQAIYHGLANGVSLGLSLGAVPVLNEWYRDPTEGKNEPFFTATSLSGAGVLMAERWFRSAIKEQAKRDKETSAEGKPR